MSDYDDGDYDPRDAYDVYPDDYDPRDDYDAYPDDYDPRDDYDAYQDDHDPRDYYADQQDYWADQFDDRREYEEDEDVEELVAQMTSLTVGREYRRYGHFECKACNRSWTSAQAYCEYKGKENGVDVFKPMEGSRQACQMCKEYYLPYKNNALRKPVGETTGQAAHQAHLCERCQAGNRCRWAA